MWSIIARCFLRGGNTQTIPFLWFQHSGKPICKWWWFMWFICILQRNCAIYVPPMVQGSVGYSSPLLRSLKPFRSSWRPGTPQNTLTHPDYMRHYIWLDQLLTCFPFFFSDFLSVETQALIQVSFFCLLSFLFGIDVIYCTCNESLFPLPHWLNRSFGSRTKDWNLLSTILRNLFLSKKPTCVFHQ